MAIGDNYSNNNGNSNGNNGRLFENTYYSRFRVKNYSDNTMIGLYYRSGLMYLEMSSVGENYKVDPIINICLSPMKAHLLVNEIDKFLAYKAEGKIKENVAFGVNAGMGEKVSYIGFHANKEGNSFITIGKFDGNGNIIEAHTFAFNVDGNYGLEWSDINANALEKSVDNNAEIIMLRNAVEDFSRAINGAAGYAAVDINRYEAARVLRKMDPIYDKLGIERRNSGNGSNRNYGSNNFLSNAGNSNSNHASFEELEDALEG